MEVQRLQQLLRLDVQRAEARQQFFVAELDVLRRRHGRHQARLLVDHADAGGERVARLLEIDRLAVDIDFARGQPDRARDRLAQRRLAGAVLADQRMDLAGKEIEIDAFDGVHAAIDLAAVDDAQHRLARGAFFLDRRRGRHGSVVHLQVSGIEQQASGAARGDHDAVLGVAGAGDAVEAAAGAAVQAVDRLALAVEMDEQAIGTRRRPRFLDAERLDRADLHRLKTIAAAGKGRRDPVVGRHGRDHLLAEIIFLEHELDQVGAPREQAEEKAALRVAMQTRRDSRADCRRRSPRCADAIRGREQTG